jgi:hypothetical protein
MKTERALYVNVVATMQTNGNMILGQIYPVPALPRQFRSEALQTGTLALAEFQDKAGTVVWRQQMEAQRLCSIPVPGSVAPRPPGNRVYAAIVVLPDDAAILRILENGAVAAERKVPSTGPMLDFQWTPGTSELKGVHKVGWKATHPEGAPMVHTLCLVPEKGPWLPLSFPANISEVSVNFDELYGGKLAFGVISTDGFYVAKAKSATFQRPLSACVAIISSPRAGETTAAGGRIVLDGYGYYRETGEFERKWLFWSDDQVGDLGFGKRIEVFLKPGKHQITLRAGSPGREGKAQVSFVL